MRNPPLGESIENDWVVFGMVLGKSKAAMLWDTRHVVRHQFLGVWPLEVYIAGHLKRRGVSDSAASTSVADPKI